MIKLRNLKILFWIMLFKLFLEISYIQLINPIWGYMGFELEMNLYKIFESYLMIIMLYCFVPKSESRVSDLFIQFLFLMMIVPTLSLYALKNTSREFIYIFTSGFLITITVVRFIPKIKPIRIRIKKSVIMSTVFFLSIITYILLIKDNGIPSFQALNLLSVYEVRSGFQTSLRITGYLLMWQAKIINPFLIAYYYHRKKAKQVAVVSSLQLVLFLLTGHKSFLFAILLVIGSIYLIKKKSFYPSFSRGLSLIVLFSLIIGVLEISIYPTAFITNRVLFVPAQNYFYYYDFFSINPKMYFSQSIIGNIFGVESVYSTNITYMIGELFYGKPKMMVNTGYIADAYMNLGIFGVWLISFLLGVIFVLIDQLGKFSDKTVIVSMFILPVYTLVDGALQTTLLTHGLMFGIILLYFINERKDIESKLIDLNNSKSNVIKTLKIKKVKR